MTKMMAVIMACRIVTNRGHFSLKKLRKFPPVLSECIFLFNPYYHSLKAPAFDLSDSPNSVDYMVKIPKKIQTTYCTYMELCYQKRPHRGAPDRAGCVP